MMNLILTFKKKMPHSRLIFSEQVGTLGAIPQREGFNSRNSTCERAKNWTICKKVDMLLNIGDLIIAYGPTRYNWTHKINHGKNG